MRAAWARLLVYPVLAPVALACGPHPGAGPADDLVPARLAMPSVAARAVGCWELRWSVTGGVTGTTMVAMPDSIQLRGSVVFGTSDRLVNPATHPDGRLASSAAGTGRPEPWESRFRVNRWRTEADSVRIRFGDGEGLEWNVSLGLDEEDDDEAGGYGAPSDGEDGGAAAIVRARRISCEIG